MFSTLELTKKLFKAFFETFSFRRVSSLSKMWLTKFVKTLKNRQNLAIKLDRLLKNAKDKKKLRNKRGVYIQH